MGDLFRFSLSLLFSDIGVKAAVGQTEECTDDNVRTMAVENVEMCIKFKERRLGNSVSGDEVHIVGTLDKVCICTRFNFVGICIIILINISSTKVLFLNNELFID